ncbi:putative endo-beta-1,4-glucanase celB [Talaromyces proteolyticus]|uniref:Glucanase n=1 Tax=Talaromyces proteolyticus TaxID=1131652 RepID=A0AAD4KYX4_9EURO|nr:putative endo-beta-1,4-glucanase celB [Talaromyces proteolyticus]KAH8703552.1 putative endo-beta-1,4-glucanase celB [Talaromyces proteolyticus]
MAGTLALSTLLVLPLVSAQAVGIPDAHPQLVTYKCKANGGCQAQDTSVVIDFTFHSVHEKNSSTSCYNGSVDTSLCPDTEMCTQNCVVDGAANYTEFGVTVAGSSLTMHQYMTVKGETEVTSSRLYLLDNASQNYAKLQLLNQEFAFDVDVSTLVCGMNGALYLSEMDLTGGRSTSSPAGAAYGAGYCDAQCPKQAWFNGAVNTQDLGACCNEMDIWEANALSTQLTPHPCTKPGIYGCSSDDCGSNGVCEESGCGFNPYGLGLHNYYGYGGRIDTSKPFTVVTQFLTNDNTTTGTLSEIRRLYVQNGTVIQNAVATVAPFVGTDSITDKYCANADSGFASRGGLKTSGEALDRGMTLVFSIWNDNSQFMNWLDSGNAGPCNSTEGNPSIIEQTAPYTSVTFSNIKWGDIGSTYKSTRRAW